MNHAPWPHVRPIRAAFEQLDRIRRQQGAMFDAAGWGPLETPYRIVHSQAGLKVRKYGEDTASQAAPTLLIVPAPIKQAYIWDLAPEVSVIRRCLESGLRIYLAEWAIPSDNGNNSERDFGLADYGNRLLSAALDTIEEDCGNDKIILAGHSLGGVLTTIFAGLHPRNVHAMLLLEVPLHFSGDAGDFAPLVAATPDTRPWQATFATVPGSMLNLVSAAAAPHVFQWERCLDWLLSIMNPEALDICLRVERWTYDEFPLPGRLFADIVELLYRDDRLMNGSLRIDGRHVGPGDINMPLLNVIDPRSTIIPPQSILPFHEAAASTKKKILWYDGDVGVGIQHVGVLVGSRAHAFIWPAIFDWLDDLGILRHAR